MTLPGIDKGLKGMCKGEQRRINVPWRLAQKKHRGKVWKHIPSEEHWLRFDVELTDVRPFSLAEEFRDLDVDQDTFITESDLVKWSEQMRTDYGKTWRNEDVDDVIAARYYVNPSKDTFSLFIAYFSRYFDESGDGKVDFGEFQKITERDIQLMEAKKDEKKPDGRKRDPGFAWILDFNNDGVVSYSESDESASTMERGPILLPIKREEL